MADFQIVEVNEKNVDRLGLFCVANKKHPGYVAKRAWLRQRFAEGLRILLAVTPDGHKAGFLEYVPAEFTWRVVEAPGCLVIHCIWVKSAKYPLAGITASLLGKCRADAAAQGRAGVAVVTSDGTWMAGNKIVLRHGFRQVDDAPPHYQLLYQHITDGSPPAFPNDWEARCARFRGLQLIYTPQCPYIGKAVAELPPVARNYGVELRLVELKDSSEARARMPSPYGMVNLVYDGRLLADHPISATRFGNILQRDLHLKLKRSEG